MRDTALWAAARCVGAVVQQSTSQLEAAKDQQQVECTLRTVLQLFIHDDPHSKQLHEVANDQQQQRLLQHAKAVGWPALQKCFYEDQFGAWATNVLTVAAGEWLPRAEGPTLRSLIADTFTCSPPAVALAALVGHLSTVLPKHSSSSGPSSITVTALAADTAAELLVERFAAAGSRGIWQLLKCCDALDTSPLTDCQQQQQQQQWQQHLSSQKLLQGQQQSSADQQCNGSCEKQRCEQQLDLDQPAKPAASCWPESWAVLCPINTEEVLEAALHLVSIPDRAQQLPTVPKPLQPCCFIQHVLMEAVGYIAAANSSSKKACNGSGSSSSSSSGGDGRSAVPGAVRLVALVLQKFVTRGDAKHAAAALLQLLCFQQQQQQQHKPSSEAGVLAGCLVAVQQVLLNLSSHTAATEKLVVQLLRQASNQQQQLRALLCPLLPIEPNLRTMTTHKLLLGRTLPTAAMQQLLHILHSCQPSLIPEAAAKLAQAWCDKSTILQVPVQQQAYITAALAACIQQLPRELLDPSTAPVTAAAAAAGSAESASSQNPEPSPHQRSDPQQMATLLPSILQGVSSRLASPSPAIRVQAMRVGRGFAVKLDPAKPLFEEAGELALMPEELWPGAMQLQPQQQLLQGVAGGVTGASNSCSTGDNSSSKFKALQRLQEAAMEPDSDDDEEDLASKCSSTAAAAAAPSCSSTPSANGGAVNGLHDSNPQDADADTWSDAGSEGSAASLVAFDLQEDLSAEEWWGPDGLGLPEGKQLSLRGLAAALRKQDDVTGALEALGRVEVLVRAEPDELPVVAPELARSLLHCRVPVWASPESATTSPYDSSSSSGGSGSGPGSSVGLHPNAEVQRQRALTAVLSLSPLTVGDTVIAELYSPHLDLYQRSLILDCLAAAAVEMSDPRKAPRLAAAGPGQAPKLLPSVAAGKRSAAIEGRLQQALADEAAADAGTGNGAASTAGNTAKGAAAVAPGMVEASSRVWGKVSLHKHKQAAAAAAPGSSSSSSGQQGRAVRTFRNRFAPVAIRWASLLLKECDVKKHGVDLFGRDSQLLGRLLTVLGTFVECAAATPAAVPLTAGLLEVIKAREVSQHQEVFVRRCALVAASQVVRHLPPARLAGAMVGRQQDVQDAVLVERLQWLMGWAQSVAAGDVDEHCRMLAAGCVAWHVELAEGAMAALEHLPEPEGPSLSHAVRSGRGGGALKSGAGEGLEIRVPSLQERMVLQ